MHESGRRVFEHGPGPFVTGIVRAVRGAYELETSRRRRKRLPRLAVDTPDERSLAATGQISHDWTRLWAPHRLGWWVGVLFMIGSALFAAGGLRTTWPGAPLLRGVDRAAVDPVFFVGSVFFTGAAYLQLYEALNGDGSRRGEPRRFIGWQPRDLGYLSALVQLAGAVIFNVNSADALISGLGWRGEDLLVWTPDVVGCVCFLVASQLAIVECTHRWLAFRPGELAWWIVTVNMAGSVFFMVSGLGSLTEPGGATLAPLLANGGLFVGAVCFFLGSYLLIPEQFETAEQGAMQVETVPA